MSVKWDNSHKHHFYEYNISLVDEGEVVTRQGVISASSFAEAKAEINNLYKNTSCDTKFWLDDIVTEENITLLD